MRYHGAGVALPAIRPLFRHHSVAIEQAQLWLERPEGEGDRATAICGSTNVHGGYGGGSGGAVAGYPGIGMASRNRRWWAE